MARRVCADVIFSAHPFGPGMTFRQVSKMTGMRNPDSLYGKTLRWTFTGGPVAGKTFEHTFYEDGSCLFRSVSGREKGESARARIGASIKVSEEIFLSSYLMDSGYTLTVVLNFKQWRVVAFASNDREWYQQQGTFEVVDDSKYT